MLNTLCDFPKLNTVTKSDIPEITRLIVHETGHIVAAAAVSIPTDYLVIDEAIEAFHHGGYIDEAYRPWLDLPFYHTARVRILAAGFAAELAIFGAADLSISDEDLSSIAHLLGMARTGDWMINTARYVAQNYKPLLPAGAENAIKTIYPKIVSTIHGKQHLIDSAHVIPFPEFDHALLQLSNVHREGALERTKHAGNRQNIIATLRGNVRSGG